MLTIAQVQALLPLPKSTLHDLIQAGILPAMPVPTAGGGRRVLVFREDLEAFVDELRRNGKVTRQAQPDTMDVDQILRDLRKAQNR